MRQARIERGVYEAPPKSGVYWVIWYDAEGRRHREKIGPSRELARAVYQKRRLEVREGRDFPETLRRRSGPTWGQLCEDFKKAHPHHWSIRVGYFRRISEEWFPRLPAAAVGPRQIQAQLAALEGDHRGSTLNRYRAVVSAICSWAIRTGTLDQNPARLVRAAREDGQRTRFLSNEEEKNLLAKIEASHAAYAPLVRLALHTGLRRGEQWALRWEDVDLEAGILAVRRSKSGRPRFVPINDVAREALLHLRKRGGDMVCPHKDPRHWFEPAAKAAGLARFRWHDLRHTFASRLAMAGVSLVAIQQLLGHASVQTTMRYAHLAPSYARDAVLALGRPQAAATSTAPAQSKGKQRRLHIVRTA